MQRRSFLKVMALVPGLAIKPPQEERPSVPRFTGVYNARITEAPRHPYTIPDEQIADPITYTDSEGHTQAELDALGDDNRKTGVTYQP